MVIVFLGGGYWYYVAEAVCDVPIVYRIGEIDSRFNLTPEEARNAIADAGSIWEDSTGRNLFTYDTQAEFVINFIFDGRQEYTNTEQNLRETLDEQQGVSDDVQSEHRLLVRKYSRLEEEYDEQSEEYAEKLSAYNTEVERWNSAGGAPEDIYENLEDKQALLAKERNELNEIAFQLNELIVAINKIGEKGNVLVTEYNDTVDDYNSQYTESREFTQGDYQGDHINIYQFVDSEELQLVLAHELGHALSISHVSGENSIMYHFMGGQNIENGLTIYDKEAFVSACGEKSFFPW